MGIAGIVLIFFSCTICGFYFTSRLRERSLILQQIQTMLHQTQTQIRYNAAPLYEMFRSFSGAGASMDRLTFIGPLVRFLEQGMAFPPAFEQAIRQWEKQTLLEKRDLALLLEFGEGLGTCDADGQVSQIKLLSERLEVLQEEAYSCYTAKAKLYPSLGFLLACAVTILLI